MKYLKSYQLFESVDPSKYLTEEQIRFLDRGCKFNDIRDSKWTFDPVQRLVNVEGPFGVTTYDVGQMPVNFGKVTGSFFMQGKGFHTLEGCPREVGGSFKCTGNELDSLYGAPERVAGDFDCRSCGLESLEGGPEYVGGEFSAGDNPIKSLKGSPKEVGGNFALNGKLITSLEGAPEKIGGVVNLGIWFYAPRGTWNPRGWLDMYLHHDDPAPAGIKLINTIFSPEVLKKKMEENPEKTMFMLKSVWNLPEFKEIRDQLVLPKGKEEDMDLLTNLDDVGF